MSLETKRTYMRELSDADLPALRSIFGNEKVVQYFTADKKAFSEDRILQLLDFCKTHYKQHCFGPWAVVEKTTNKVIGINGLKIVPDLELPDLGFAFLPECWRKGFAFETSQALIHYGFNTLEIKKIGAVTSLENSAAIALLEKLGMSFAKEIVRLNIRAAVYEITSP